MMIRNAPVLLKIETASNQSMRYLFDITVVLDTLRSLIFYLPKPGNIVQTRPVLWKLDVDSQLAPPGFQGFQAFWPRGVGVGAISMKLRLFTIIPPRIFTVQLAVEDAIGCSPHVSDARRFGALSVQLLGCPHLGLERLLRAEPADSCAE